MSDTLTRAGLIRVLRMAHEERADPLLVSLINALVRDFQIAPGRKWLINKIEQSTEREVEEWIQRST